MPDGRSNGPLALSDIFSAGLEQTVAAVRRQAISLAIAIVAAIGALIYAASALLIALELAFGPIGARLAVSGVLLVFAVAGYFVPYLLRPSAPPRATATTATTDMEGLSRDQRVALVLEALMLGFSMGSRKPAETSDGSK